MVNKDDLLFNVAGFVFFWFLRGTFFFGGGGVIVLLFVFFNHHFFFATFITMNTEKSWLNYLR